MAIYTDEEKAQRLKNVRASRERMKAQGFEYLNVKVPTDSKDLLKDFARELCEEHSKGV